VLGANISNVGGGTRQDGFPDPNRGVRAGPNQGKASVLEKPRYASIHLAAPISLDRRRGLSVTYTFRLKTTNGK